eukprot:3839743-Alexandrium_andersonii.AAC.1
MEPTYGRVRRKAPPDPCRRAARPQPDSRLLMPRACILRRRGLVGFAAPQAQSARCSPLLARASTLAVGAR